MIRLGFILFLPFSSFQSSFLIIFLTWHFMIILILIFSYCQLFLLAIFPNDKWTRIRINVKKWSVLKSIRETYAKILAILKDIEIPVSSRFNAKRFGNKLRTLFTMRGTLTSVDRVQCWLERKMSLRYIVRKHLAKRVFFHNFLIYCTSIFRNW